MNNVCACNWISLVLGHLVLFSFSLCNPALVLCIGCSEDTGSEGERSTDEEKVYFFSFFFPLTASTHTHTPSEHDGRLTALLHDHMQFAVCLCQWRLNWNKWYHSRLLLLILLFLLSLSSSLECSHCLAENKCTIRRCDKSHWTIFFSHFNLNYMSSQNQMKECTISLSFSLSLLISSAMKNFSPFSSPFLCLLSSLSHTHILNLIWRVSEVFFHLALITQCLLLLYSV